MARHMKHEGKLFECTFEGCKQNFTLQGNMTRHVKEFHNESASAEVKQHVCSEHGCGKVFKYLSKLKKHEDSHGTLLLFDSYAVKLYFDGNICYSFVMFGFDAVKLDSVEAFCAEPDCMKYFSNEQCLKEHIRSCHQHIMCDQCGTKQLKKNIKRHMRMHKEGPSLERIKCSFKGCMLTFSNVSPFPSKTHLLVMCPSSLSSSCEQKIFINIKHVSLPSVVQTSNLNQHIQAVHLELKPFVCGMPGCHERFGFNHVRNRHKQTGCHIYTRVRALASRAN